MDIEKLLSNIQEKCPELTQEVLDMILEYFEKRQVENLVKNYPNIFQGK